MAKDKKTEDQIIEAAHKVFQEEGFAGARMQKIADTADINKGLLHYYFKTKDKLFYTVFSTAVEKMLGRISGIFNEEIPLFEKLDKVVDGYFEVLSKNSFLPAFVISELNKNPERITDKIMKSPNRPNVSGFRNQIAQAVKDKEIRPIDPDQLIIHVISTCVFAFIGKPLIQIILEKNKTEYNQLLKQRKEEVKLLIKNGIKIHAHES